MKNNKKLILMFLSFFKIGAFTFGGGYAMIPLIEAEVVKKQKWINKEEFLDIIAISQSFPGAMAVNACTFIGYKIGGLLGALLGLLGVVLPSFIIIILIATLFVQFRQNYYVDLIFKGISAAVPTLVLTAVVSLFQAIDKNYINFIIIALVVFALKFFNLHPVIVILFSALYGIVFLRKQVK